MATEPRKPLLVNVVMAAALAFFLYMCSYAPVVRICGGIEFAEEEYIQLLPTIANYGDGRKYPAYKPADWLIDNTPLRFPLFWWAAVFGVRSDFEIAYNDRTISDRLEELP